MSHESDCSLLYINRGPSWATSGIYLHVNTEQIREINDKKQSRSKLLSIDRFCVRMFTIDEKNQIQELCTCVPLGKNQLS